MLFNARHVCMCVFDPWSNDQRFTLYPILNLNVNTQLTDVIRRWRLFAVIGYDRVRNMGWRFTEVLFFVCYSDMHTCLRVFVRPLICLVAPHD